MDNNNIYFLEFNDDSVEVYAGDSVPQEYLDRVEKSLSDQGYEKVQGKSIARFKSMKQWDFQPLQKSANLCDSIIEKLEKRASEAVSKEEDLPYWHPKAQLANARRVRAMDRQARYQRNAKPAASPAPSAPTAPGAKPVMKPVTPPGVPPILGDGTNRKYIGIPEYKKSECSGKKDCTCEKCIKVNKSLPSPTSTYTPGELETYKKRLNKSLEWTEREMANKVAKLPMFSNPAPRQPSNEELFGGMVVSEQEAQHGYDGRINNWFAEASKPLSELKKFASEEEEIAYWRSVRAAPSSGGEGQN